jgi:sugar lactone lactonase YvrE
MQIKLLISPRIYILGLVLVLAGECWPISSSDDGNSLIRNGREEMLLAGHQVIKILRPSSEFPNRLIGIKAIVSGQNSSIVIFGRFGAWIYDEGRERWEDISNSGADSNVRSFDTIVASNEGIVWALNFGRPTYFNGEWHSLSPPVASKAFAKHFPGEERNSLLLRLLNPLRCMFPAKNGKIFFIRDDLLGSFYGEVWNEVAFPPSNLESEYFRLGEPMHFGQPVPTLKDNQERRIRRTLGLSTQTDQFLKMKPRSILSETYCGLMDRDGVVFLGADRAVFRIDLDNGRWQMFPLPRGLVQAVAVHEGRDGKLWYSDFFGNVGAFDKTTGNWTVYNLMDSLPLASRPSPIELSPEEKELLEHMRALAGREKGGSLTPAPLRVRSIYEDRDGRLMIGTERGLIVFEQKNKTWSLFTTENSSLPSNRVNCLTEDYSGRIWIGTEGGIIVLSK